MGGINHESKPALARRDTRQRNGASGRSAKGCFAAPAPQAVAEETIEDASGMAAPGPRRSVTECAFCVANDRVVDASSDAHFLPNAVHPAFHTKRSLVHISPTSFCLQTPTVDRTSKP